ncbi:hypothetical protein O3P69_014511 [Scylla paramamosain]|uniref:Uncharacterized protein n=1 Tax=Scylla paramamosain TaxID=85552 RepID=A0AAW0TBX0_SCYPA
MRGQAGRSGLWGDSRRTKVAKYYIVDSTRRQPPQQSAHHCLAPSVAYNSSVQVAAHRLLFGSRSSTPRLLKVRHSTTKALNHSLGKARLAELIGFRLTGKGGRHKQRYLLRALVKTDCNQTSNGKVKDLQDTEDDALVDNEGGTAEDSMAG